MFGKTTEGIRIAALSTNPEPEESRTEGMEQPQNHTTDGHSSGELLQVACTRREKEWLGGEG